jgi:zinc transport system substrate-binding protein
MKILLAITVLLLAGCGVEREASGTRVVAADTGVPVIYTVNYPLAWMAQQLAGDAGAVAFPAPAGIDPALWQPDVNTVLQYQRADLVLLNGANYARWTAYVSLPPSRLFDTSASYRDQLISVAAAPVHSHGPGGEHSHGELAFTTWLDLELAQRQMQAVATALQRLLPAESAAIEQRRASRQRELGSMDTRLTVLGQLLGNTPVLYSHPVYQYLQRRYQFNGRALHWEPDQVPSEAQWSELEGILQAHPAQIMLWEAQPLPEVQARLAELGVKTVVFSPMGNRPSSGDFASGMTANIDRLEQLSGIDARRKGQRPHTR